MDAGGMDADSPGPVPAAEFTQLPLELSNPQPAGCNSTEEVSVPVVPPPVVHDVTPDPLCNIDQTDDMMKATTTVTVSGFGFLVVDGTRPTVDIGEQTYEVAGIDGCTDVQAEGREVQSCTSVSVEVQEDDLPTGRADVAVNNPEPANCTSEGSAPLRLVPQPTVTAAAPSPVCTSDRARQITVRGSDFYVVESEMPMVHFDEMVGSWQADSAEGCRRVAVDGETRDVRRCSLLRVTIPQGELLPEPQMGQPVETLREFNVSVTNPGQTGCVSEDQVTFRTAAPPTVDTIVEDFACLQEAERSFTLTGSNFLQIGDGMLTRNPMVEIDGQFYAPDDVTGCTVSEKDSDVSHCSEISFTLPRRDVGPGDYEVRVHQPRPATCAGSDSVELRIEPPPSVSDVTEQPLCAEKNNVVTVHGSDFLVVDGTKPTVTISGETFSGQEVTMTQCAGQPDPAIGSRSVQRCSKLQVQAPVQKQSVGIHDVVVMNPKASDPSVTDCKSLEKQQLRMVTSPSLDYVEPEPICTAQHANSLTVVGGDFLVIQPNGGQRKLPTVTFADNNGQGSTDFTPQRVSGCRAVPIPGDDPQVKACDRLFITVPQGQLPASTYSVTVQNPEAASCTSPSVDYTVVPPPTLASIEPSDETPKKPLTCLDESKKSFDVVGTDFLIRGGPSPSAGTKPEVEINGVFYDTTVEDSDCAALPGQRTTTYLCTRLSFELPQDAVSPGNYPVKVHNPKPADCVSNTQDLFVAGSPFVSDIGRSPMCNAKNAYVLTVEGRDFLKVDQTDPTVTLDGNTVQTLGLNGCSATPVSGVESCTSIDIRVPPGTVGGPAQVTEHLVEVTNPSPAACDSDERVVEKNVPPPTVASATLQKSCPGAGPDKLVVEGSFFVGMGSDTPDVTVDQQGNQATYQDVSMAGDCTSMTNVTQPTKYCNRLRFDLGQQSGLSGGSWNIGVQNAQGPPRQCSISGTVQVQEVPPAKPIINSVQPTQTCATGGQLTIEGSQFKKGLTVQLAGIRADNVNYISDKKVVATWSSKLPTGAQLLEIINPDGCVGSYAQQPINVSAGPLAIYVDPAVHYNKIKLRATAYFTKGRAQDVTKFRIRGPKGVVRELQFSTIPGEDDQLRVTLPNEDPKNPGNPLPAGKYDVQIAENIGNVPCGQWIDNLLTVVDNQKLAVKAIDPKFGWKDEPTSVRITARSNPSAGQTQFQSTPRVYINPVNPQVGSFATELSGVTFNSKTELNGIVPKSTQQRPIPAGKYDVVVINPDNTVGVLSGQNGFTVTDKKVPIIDNVTPGTWNTPGTLTVDVQGSNFRLNQNQTNPVTVTCQNGPSPDDVRVNFNNTGSSTIEVEVKTDSMLAGDACELTVTNPNGSVGNYSPIATVNPAYNFISFTDTKKMMQARRWPAMSSGIPSRQQRFVYAYGGDDGSTTASGIRKSGEFAQIDRFGAPQSWEMQRYDLPGNGRTFARSTRIRDFIYLVGGHDGNGPTNSVLRTNVLDPLHTPSITDLDFAFGEAGVGGLQPGVYYYRVAAVHTNNTAHNPGGETLTSNVQPVFVPNLGGRFDVRIKLTWSKFTNVKEYRVYRSPNPNMSVGEEKLLKVIPAGNTTYTDDGSDQTSSDSPLAVGSTGVWHQVGQLATARMKHGVRSVIDPTDPKKVYIYAVGGETGGNQRLDTIERVVINDPDPAVKRDQTVGGISTMGPKLSTARTELETMVATPQNASNLTANTAHLYAVGGLGTRGPGPGGGGVKARKTIDIFEISAGSGDLSARTGGTDMLKARAGFGGTIANNYMLSFGGQNAAPDDTGDNSDPLTAGGDVTGWNSLGTIGMQPRYLLGRTSLVGFFYLGGGVTQGGGILDTVEYSVVGTTRR